ncbi:HU family DNA-binding protein [Vibrio sp. 10N.261.46.E12]|uniref:HU family DNA-binding protein n=1 Tax=unclassified Vibrio TaxID=2614977 RepID=UPI000978C666|nr:MULTISPECIES: HU family DNA-binding protein [unclassified Vibrio]OMO36224.1 hypothetical protein BH584_05460 [Vibrio sp. 10N.261.45.E1]PMJ34424.1 hypothetical protein BCU27_03075 [Vibrio sp. 10N.286.45.B6]PML86795.1 hypothetical protein BCT66_00780 [Vibrio sp. 10N.261.49.E11]PMM76795.1 hypothetical protein BCT48_24655 [Vibrio sp. 10N.261.46.F12]PMM81837.1 hypothetical protein BCT46_15640 [Vibrio sp. 10N.261.46.E8]
MTVTKLVLGEELAECLDLKIPTAVDFVADVFEEITSELEKGNTVSLQGFGQFRLIDKDSRPGRNPKTNEPHVISKRRVCVLKNGVWLHDAATSFADSYRVNLSN